MTELQIEDNVPLPTGYGTRSFVPTVKTLKVGQSVVVPLPGHKANNIAFNALGKGNFTCRKVDDKSTRIWRTK